MNKTALALSHFYIRQTSQEVQHFPVFVCGEKG